MHAIPDPNAEADAPKTRIYVCVTCRAEGQNLEPKEARAGYILHEALTRDPSLPADAFEIIPIECMSVCKRPCAITYAAPGKWTYVYGGLIEADNASLTAQGARLYAQSPDGIVAWKARPPALRKGIIARIPPLTPFNPDRKPNP